MSDIKKEITDQVIEKLQSFLGKDTPFILITGENWEGEGDKMIMNYFSNVTDNEACVGIMLELCEQMSEEDGEDGMVIPYDG